MEGKEISVVIGRSKKPVSFSEQGVSVVLGKGPVRYQRLPSSSPGKIAVTPAGYDDIGQVLKAMGLPFVTVKPDQLADPRVLLGIGTLFLNCSESAEGHAASAARALKDFVLRGGSIYASDWAAAYIERAFPDALRGGRDGEATTIEAKVCDRELGSALGPKVVSLKFDMDEWFTVSRTVAQRANAKVYLEAGGLPIVLSFRHGGGFVFYTAFHNRAQPGQVIQKLMRFLVLMPAVRDSSTAAAAISLSGPQLRELLGLPEPKS